MAARVAKLVRVGGFVIPILGEAALAEVVGRSDGTVRKNDGGFIPIGSSL